jgi:hypothetical protein
MTFSPTGVLPGTLDLLILKAVSLGDRHGYGVLLRLQQMTCGALAVEQGALHRLEPQGLLEGQWARLCTTGARSSIGLRTRAGGGFIGSPRIGTAWWASWPAPWRAKPSGKARCGPIRQPREG